MIGGSFLGIQWLGLHALTAEGLGSNPAQGTKILQAALQSQKNFLIKKKKKKSRVRRKDEQRNIIIYWKIALQFIINH